MEVVMEVVYTHCCGLDVHKQTVVACLFTPSAPGHPAKQIRTFGTTTAEILALADWLSATHCTHVAMESTGVYWKPIYNLLEGNFELLVVNAQHIKAVPGRKTDVGDAEWIADLLRHGLLRGSFVPAAEQREVRELTRYRTTLVRDRARHIQRLQKVLEDANLKLAGVATDITGVSARTMLDALLGGEDDPAVLADLARGRLREKRAALEAALTGRVRPHHRFLLTEELRHLDYLEEAVGRVTAEIEERLRPFEEELARLDTVPGINQRTAQVIVAELGVDLGRFPTAGHLASWAGLCPGNHVTAGKRQRGTTRPANPWLRQVLMEAAHGAARSKGTVLSAQYRRLARRIGRRKALVAVAHSILVIVYHVLTEQREYEELGANYYDERDRAAVERSLVRRLERLGNTVTLTRREAA
jgi:transposase